MFDVKWVIHGDEPAAPIIKKLSKARWYEAKQ